MWCGNWCSGLRLVCLLCVVRASYSPVFTSGRKKERDKTCCSLTVMRANSLGGE